MVKCLQGGLKSMLKKINPSSKGYFTEDGILLGEPLPGTMTFKHPEKEGYVEGKYGTINREEEFQEFCNNKPCNRCDGTPEPGKLCKQIPVNFKRVGYYGDF